MTVCKAENSTGRQNFMAPNGEMFFGGINGFNSFFPDSLKNNPYPPRVAITGFKLFNNTAPIGNDSPLKMHISETKEITLSHWQNDITFEFVALHYNKPEKINMHICLKIMMKTG